VPQARVAGARTVSLGEAFDAHNEAVLSLVMNPAPALAGASA
jgi:hypothetical protein